MRHALRPLLMGLVLANLAFVHLTEAARLTWLLPLVGLTLLSPILVRFRRHWLSRVLWNGAVIGVFALLVHHTTSAGVHNLLEDGLLLAALCQVHLLNNIGPEQKPDLLLVNSFLIAVVTSFLSLDTGYSIVFLLYVPALVLSMQVLALSRIGGEREPPLAPVLWNGMARSGVALLATFLVFFLLPRDFGRQGLLSEYVDLGSPGSRLTVGFTEEVDLTKKGPAREDAREVLRVRLLSGAPADVPEHWRGAVLDRFDGRRWYRENGGRRPARLARVLARVLVRPTPAFRDRRFSPLNSRAESPGPVQRLAVGKTAPIRYPASRRYLRLPADPTLQIVSEKAQEIAGGLSRKEMVERLASWLRVNRSYIAPTASGRAESLAEFVQGRAGGHCEYFATALAVMLRSQGVPCRLATGYRSGEWTEEGRVLIVRARHAHAWVEVLDPARGWSIVDPTPAGTGAENDEAAGFLSGLGALGRSLWRTVTGFDAESRKRALAYLAALPGNSAAAVRDHPAATLGVAALLVLLLGTRRRRRTRSPPAVRDYARALKRARMSARPGETPRATLQRARLLAQPDARLEALAAATERHERRRYAGSTS